MSNSKELSKERYSQFADGYITSLTHAKGADLDMLIDIAQPEAHWQVLDIATGGGHTALKFAPHVAKVIATDLTPTMLDKASEFIKSQGVINVEFEVADAENLPFDNEQFDLVTCRIAPHHFPDVAKFVQESARVLKVGGLLLVQDHVLSEDVAVASLADSFEKLRDPSHNQAYSANAWKSFFESVGLKVQTMKELTKRHQFLDWSARQGNSAEVQAELISMVANAPEAVKAWMQPMAWETKDASFVNHHIIIAGYKSDSKK